MPDGLLRRVQGAVASLPLLGCGRAKAARLPGWLPVRLPQVRMGMGRMLPAGEDDYNDYDEDFRRLLGVEGFVYWVVIRVGTYVLNNRQALIIKKFRKKQQQKTVECVRKIIEISASILFFEIGWFKYFFPRK
jgi:hypothetical protein